jgi:hypothetical protein
MIRRRNPRASRPSLPLPLPQATTANKTPAQPYASAARAGPCSVRYVCDEDYATQISVVFGPCDYTKEISLENDFPHHKFSLSNTSHQGKRGITFLIPYLDHRKKKKSTAIQLDKLSYPWRLDHMIIYIKEICYRFWLKPNKNSNLTLKFFLDFHVLCLCISLPFLIQKN